VHVLCPTTAPFYVGIALLAALVVTASAASAQSLAFTNVTVIDVDDGTECIFGVRVKFLIRPGFGFWFGTTLEVVLALTGQLLDLLSKPFISQHQAGVQGVTDIVDQNRVQCFTEYIAIRLDATDPAIAEGQVFRQRVPRVGCLNSLPICVSFYSDPNYCCQLLLSGRRRW
jgi:hypothetical protein